MSSAPDRQKHQKEPWLAVNLSGLLSGLGQIYSGRRYRGWSLICSQILLLILAVYCLISSVPIAYISIVITGYFGIVIFSLFDAYDITKQGNSAEFTELRSQTKDPWLAIFLNRIFILPIGHLYLGKPWGGLIVLAVILGFAVVNATISLMFKQIPLIPLLCSIPIGIVEAVAVIYLTYRDAPSNRQTNRQEIKLFIVAIVAVILMSTALAITIRAFVVEARYIPSGAMLPTIQINDRLIIDKLTYRFHPPERGDIIVFNPTEELQRGKFKDAFIKRIIGLPGDLVEVNNRKVYVNGKVLSENYIAEAPKYTWTKTKSSDPQFAPDRIIPKGYYLVFGDNRNNSYDSHYWGFVSQEKIIGRATKRFWPLQRSGNL